MVSCARLCDRFYSDTDRRTRIESSVLPEFNARLDDILE